jgi:hypothetical protein
MGRCRVVTVTMALVVEIVAHDQTNGIVPPHIRRH